MNKYYFSLLIFVLSGMFTEVKAQGSDCATASPFCTGIPVSFANNTNVPSLGTIGCLGTSPNPAWYYMQISNGGNLTLNIGQVNSSGAGIDVDFICWGPFTSMAAACASNFFTLPSVDCSYSANATETCTIPNAIVGQFYLLLLTNFSNQPGTISFVDSSNSTATTNCGIVCNAPSAVSGPALHMDCTMSPVYLGGISYTPGVTFHWTGPGGFSTNNQFPPVSVPGTYTLTVTDPLYPNCPATAHQVVDVTNTGAPNISTGATANLTCVINTVNLVSNSTTANVSYSWTGPGGFTSNVQNPSGVSAAGTYTVKVTDPLNGCTSTATQSVTLNTTQPNVTMGATQSLTCTTSAVSLTANSITAGATFAWTGPGGFTSNVHNPSGVNTAGNYTVIVTNPVNGCTKTGVQTVSTNTSPPTVFPGPQQTINCVTNQVSLSVTSFTPLAGFQWTGPGGFTSNSSNPTGITTVGSYTVTATDPANGCTSSSTQTVVSNTIPPNISTGANQLITCLNSSVNLSANSTTANVIYNWSGPNSYLSAVQNPTGINNQGIYNVIVTDQSNGCTSSANVNINIDTLSPNLSVGAMQTLNCVVHAVNLTANSSTAGVNYNWTGPGGYTSNLSNPAGVTVAGNYTVGVTDPLNGCSSSAVQNVALNTTAPNVASGASQMLTCVTSSVDLTANSSTPGVNYNWIGPNGFVSAVQNPTGVTNQGNYTVQVTDPVNGCTASANQNVFINITPPNISMGAQQILNCVVLTVNLAANSTTPNATYNWTGPNSFSSAVKNPVGISSPGIYTATVTDPVNGCTSSASQTVVLNNTAPNLVVGPTLSLTCPAPTVKLNCTSTTSNVSYFWKDSLAGFTSQMAEPTVGVVGTYIITVTDPVNGCTSTSQEIVNTLISIPDINIQPSTLSGCQPLSVHFSDLSTVASGTINTWKWSFGNGDSNFVMNPSVLYSTYGKFSIGLKVTTTLGCEKDTVISDLITVFRKPIADFRYTPDVPSIFLPVVNFVDYTKGDGREWFWDFGDRHISSDENPTHTFLNAGKYNVSLIVISDEGCKDTTMEIIEVKKEYALYAPTAFTPNNDGENDIFMAKGVGITKFSMLLFDRWGKLFFSSDDLSKGWDGTYGNDPAPQGIYTYKINYTDTFGGKHEYLNTITLLR